MNHSMNSVNMVVVCWCGKLSRPGIFTNWHSSLFKMLKPLVALRSAHTVLPVCLVKQLICLCKTFFTNFAAKFHTHTHTHTHTHHTHSHTHAHTHTHVALQALSLSLCHQSDEQPVHVLSSVDVARWLMLITKWDKLQFVVKTWC